MVFKYIIMLVENYSCYTTFILYFNVNKLSDYSKHLSASPIIILKGSTTMLQLNLTPTVRYNRCRIT